MGERLGCVLTRWDSNFCICYSPLQGCKKLLSALLWGVLYSFLHMLLTFTQSSGESNNEISLLRNSKHTKGCHFLNGQYKTKCKITMKSSFSSGKLYKNYERNEVTYLFLGWVGSYQIECLHKTDMYMERAWCKESDYWKRSLEERN